METRIFLYLLFIYSISFSQSNDTLVLKILNKEIKNYDVISLNVEIINKTKKYVVLPIDSGKLSGYEYGLTSSEPLFSNYFDENQIKFGVRFYDNSNNLIPQGPSESYRIPNDEEMCFNNFNEKSDKVYQDNLVKYYRKKGVVKDVKWLLFLNYIKENIRIISPGQAVNLSFLFQLNENNNSQGEINKYYFDSNMNAEYIQIELFIQKSIQEYMKQIDLSFLPKNESYFIYYGKIKSNKVPMKFD